MGYTADDASWDLHMADQEARALDAAFDSAVKIAADFEVSWRSSGLAPSVSVELGGGSQDQPLFVFTIALDLDDDFDVDNWPTKDVDDMVEDLRSRLIASEVNEWDRFVTTAVRSGSSSG